MRFETGGCFAKTIFRVLVDPDTHLIVHSSDACHAADLASEQSSSSSNISFTAMAETAVCLEVCGLPSKVFKFPNDLKISELKAKICPEDWPDAILLQNGRQGPSLSSFRTILVCPQTANTAHGFHHLPSPWPLAVRLLSSESAVELDPESPVYVLPKEPHGLRSFLEQPVARISHLEWPAAMETWWKWLLVVVVTIGDHELVAVDYILLQVL